MRPLAFAVVRRVAAAGLARRPARRARHSAPDVTAKFPDAPSSPVHTSPPPSFRPLGPAHEVFAPGSTLLLRELPPHTTRTALLAALSAAGTRAAALDLRPGSPSARPHALVGFRQPTSAQRALSRLLYTRDPVFGAPEMLRGKLLVDVPGTRAPPDEPCDVFVGNVPWSATAADLLAALHPHGVLAVYLGTYPGALIFPF
jgi:hypothetical protein